MAFRTSASADTSGGRRVAIWPFVAVALSLIVGVGIGADHDVDHDQDHEGPLEFVRVHAPPGRPEEVPLDSVRHVPMSVEDFDRAVTRLSASAGDPAPRTLAASARYDLRPDAAGRLVGTLAFVLDSAPVGQSPHVPLGAVEAARATVRTGDGIGEVVVFGLPDGTAAVRTQGAGTYACEIACPPPGSGSPYRIPLVPALATRLTIALPTGLRPSVVAPAGVRLARASGDGKEVDGRATWIVEAGPASAVDLRLEPADGPPLVRAWTTVTARGGRADAVTWLEPVAAWTAEQLELAVDPGLEPTAVRSLAADDSLPGAGELAWRFGAGRSIVIDVPASLAGSVRPVVVVAAAPMAVARPRRLPVVRPAAGRWAGGGVTLLLEDQLAVDDVTEDDAVAIDPAVASRWRRSPPAATGAAEMHFEHQSPGASVTVTLRPRPAELDVVRVTTTEISPRIVLGRATCDVRVLAGEAFQIAARIGEAWLIDSVEVAELPAGGNGGATVGRSGTSAAACEWSRFGAGANAQLRIALAAAATRSRGVRLRISGHRAGMPLGATFRTADMDMVRFDGESAAAIDFRAGPETLVEIDGAAPGQSALDEPLLALVEPGPSRGRVRRGEQAAPQAARLVQRRPPLEADVDVRVVVRDGQLTETFSWTCRSQSAGMEAVVVHFSEPLGDAVAWRRADDGGIVAVRLEPADAARGEVGRIPGIAESWLVEFSPATDSVARFTAARAVDFAAAHPVPLAWVEGATAVRGTVELLGQGGAWPGIRNRRLRELPPGEAAGPQPVGEFAYDTPQSAVRADGEPALEVVPPDPASARAWAWRETTTCWVHASGLVESVSAFTIDNHGRESVAVTIPAGLRLQAITVDGTPVSLDAPPPAGGSLRVALPPTRGRVELVVRGLATRSPRLGCWRIDPIASVIDVPGLERRMRVMLPPDLDLVSPGERGNEGWAERLLAAAPAGTGHSAPTAAGFRLVEVHQGDLRRWRAIIVVRRGVVAATAVCAGLVAMACGSWAAVRRPAACAAAVAALIIMALWLPAPFASVARAAWWAMTAGVAVAFATRLKLPSSALVVPLIVAGTAVGEESVPGRGQPAAYRVLVSPTEDGATVLVPEPLFRVLAADDYAAAAAVRVIESHAEPIGAAIGDPWRMTLEVDADAGGVLVLDQHGSGATWRSPPPAGHPGVAVTVDDDRRRARLAAVAPGRHRVELLVEPAVDRRGAIETATFSLPPAPRATVGRAADERPNGGGKWQCDRADRRGPWMPAESLPDGRFAVPRAARVRLARAVDPRHVLAALLRGATSENLVDWGDTRCVVTAGFELGSEDVVVRSFVVHAAGGLVFVGRRGGPAVDVLPIGDGRHLVELVEPRAGRVRVDLEFQAPQADPVGTFDVPGVWIESTVGDTRTVRLAAADVFDVEPSLPVGTVSLRPREEDGSRVVAAWRSESSGMESAAALPGAAGGSRPRIDVRRRPQPPRGRQSLAVGFSPEAVTLVLECQINATDAALVEFAVQLPAEAVVDRVAVTAEAEPRDASVEVVTARPSPDRLRVVFQRPTTGRFRGRIEARVPGPPSPRGTMPLLYAIELGNAPIEVSWAAWPTFDVDVAAAAVPVGGDRTIVEVRPGEPGPEYALVETRASDPREQRPAQADAAARATPAEDGIAAAEVLVVADGGERVRCLARFEVTTSRSSLGVVLPPGVRLFAALVDGREARADPEGAEAWRVSLDVAPWPRAIALLYAGDLGGRLDGGEPILLEPPRLQGLACGDLLWTVDIPADFGLRVVQPGSVLDASGVEAARAAMRSRVEAAFAAAGVRAGGREAERLQGLLNRRVTGAAEHAADPWADAIGPGEDNELPRERVHVSAAGDGAVAIRVVRRADPSGPGRALATVGCAAALAACWSIGRLRPRETFAFLEAAWPWAAAAAGAVWVWTLEPALPGWTLLAVGAAAVAACGRLRWRAATAPAGEGAVATCGSTRTRLSQGRGG